MENNLLMRKVFSQLFFLQRLKNFASGSFVQFSPSSAFHSSFFATEAAGNWIKAPCKKKLQREQEDVLHLLSLFLLEPRSSFSTESNTDSLTFKPCPLSLLLLSPSFCPSFSPTTSLLSTQGCAALHSEASRGHRCSQDLGWSGTHRKTGIGLVLFLHLFCWHACCC